MQPESKSMMDLALEYAASGWPVFPVRAADEELFDASTGEFITYGAKSPLTPRGFRNATKNERIIRRLWEDNPTAMVAIPTGAPTGVWVLDVDQGEDVDGSATLAALEAEHGNLPETVTVQTPSGGRHFIFRLPYGQQVRNRGRFAPGLDTRGDGGFIVAAGSVRADGRAYTWESRPPEPADAPQWLIDMVVKQDSPTPVGGTAPSTGYVEAAVEAEIDRLESTTSGRNTQLNESAFALGTLVGAGVLDRATAESRLFAAAQFNGYVAKDSAGAARATIRSGLDSGAKHPRQVPEEMTAEEGARLAVNLIGMDKGEQAALVDLGRYLSAKLVSRPPLAPSFVPEPQENEPAAPPMHADPFNPLAADGLLRHIAEWITETAIMPVPELSLAAALGLLAGLFGDKALGPTYTGVNLYLTTILGTAGGKGYPPKAIRRISDKLGAMGVVSNGDHTSYAAFERTLRKSNTKSVTVVMDEFGITLQDVNNKRNGSAASASIRKFLLAIYDQANSVFDGRTYASADAKGTDEPIEGPALTVLGMTTLDTLYAGLTEASISDGFLNRFVFVTAQDRGHQVTPPRLHQDFSIPAHIEKGVDSAVHAFAARRGDQKDKWRVPFLGDEGGAAYKRWGEIFVWQFDPRWPSEKRDIRARAAENTLRLATLRAISKYAANPAITVEDIEWAWAVVYRSILLVQEGIRDHMSASPAETLRKSVLEALRDSSEPVPYSKLLSRRGVRGSDTRQVEEALRWLLDAKEIVDLNAKPKAGAGSKFAVCEEAA